MKDNSPHPTYLAPLLCDPAQLAREAVKRRRLFDLKTLSEHEVAEYEAAGWLFDRRLTKKRDLRSKK